MAESSEQSELMQRTTERVLLASQTVQRNGTVVGATLCRERTVSRVVAQVAMAAVTPNHFYNPHDEEEDTAHAEAVTVVRTPEHDSAARQHGQHGDDELLPTSHVHMESSGACPHPVTPLRSRVQTTMHDHIPADDQTRSNEMEINPIREPMTTVNNDGSDERLLADRSNGSLYDTSTDSGLGPNRPIQLSLENQLAEARQQLREARQQIGELRCEKAELVTVRDEELRRHRERYDALIKAISEHRQEELKKNAALESELDVIKAKEEKRKRDIEQEWGLLKEKDAELTKKAADIHRREESLRAEQRNLDERETCVAEREELEKRLSSLTESEKKLTEDLAHCKRTIAQLETENASLRQENKHLSSEIAQLREENDRLSAQLQSVEKRLEKKMDDQHKELKDQLEEVKLKLAAITKDDQPAITSHAHQESVVSQPQPSSAFPTKPDRSPKLCLRQAVANTEPQPSQDDCVAAAVGSQQSTSDTVTASGYASKVDTMAVHRITRVWPGYEQYFRNQTPSLANVIAILNELRSSRGRLKDVHDRAESHHATAAAYQPDISSALKEMEEVLSAAPTILSSIQLLRSSGGGIVLQLCDIESNVKEVIVELQGEKTTAVLGDALLSCWSVTKLCKHL